MKSYEKDLVGYEAVNKAAKNSGAVFFGCDRLYGIPVSELAEDYELNMPVYNRSVRGLSIDDAADVLDTCIYELSPDKIFVNIGENDVVRDGFNIDSFMEKYEWLLYTIYSNCHCSIYIMPIFADKSGEINERLKKMSLKYGCGYIDVKAVVSPIDFFLKIKRFLRERPIGFYEAMTI